MCRHGAGTLPPRIVPNAPARKLPVLPLAQLMSQKAAAKELGIGRATVTAWIAAGKLAAGLDPYGVVKPTRASVARLKRRMAELTAEPVAATA